MKDLKSIYKIVQDHMNEMNVLLKSTVKSRVSLLNIITHYILRKKGKQIRPMVVYLMARMCGEVSKSTHIGATMVELLHTATLVHDDVVDEAEKRRGVLTINSLWKNKASVLVGDYLLSQGLLMALESQEHDLLAELSNAVREMSEGELKQLEKTKRLNITEEEYYEIISKKTASLLRTSFKIGAMTSTEDSQLIDSASDLGFHLGMAFQIKDDLLDFQDGTGKNIGGDIKEKKLTLPLIYTLNTLSNIQRIKMKTDIRLRGSDERIIKNIITKIHESGGVDYAESKLDFHIKRSKELLNHFPKNVYQEALISLIAFVANRTK